MNEKGNRYALAALKDKRATLAGEIVKFKRQIRAREKALTHLDATLKLLFSNIEPENIKPKKAYARTQLFRHGELGRLILGALRKADGKPMISTDIVTAVLAAIEAPKSARPTISPRVKTNLNYQRQKGLVEPLEKVRGVRVWRLVC